MAKENKAVEVIEKEATSLVSRALGHEVQDQAGYEKAADLLKAVKATMDEIGAAFDPIIKKAHEAHSQALAKKAEFVTPLKSAEKALKSRMGAYYEAQEEIRRAKEAEQKRIQEAEAERLRKEAEKLEKKGKASEAEAVREVAEKTEQIRPVAEGAPKIQGIRMAEVWDFEITDPDALPREYLVPDGTKIRQVVKALKGDTNIAGVRVFKTTGVRA